MSVKCKGYRRVARRLVDSGDSAKLVGGFLEHSTIERCGADVWLAKTIRCGRWNFVGVPAKRLDLCIEETLWDSGEKEPIVVEVGQKIGRFDGAERYRLTLRRPTKNGDTSLQHCSRGLLFVAWDAHAVTIRLGAEGMGESDDWAITLARVRYTLDPAKRASDILGWHARQYYRHLTPDRVEEVARDFVLPPGVTITEANRLASQFLYQASRELGWRKLTLRERRRLGIEGAGQWHLQEAINAIVGSPTGCGEYTLSEARGQK